MPAVRFDPGAHSLGRPGSKRFSAVPPRQAVDVLRVGVVAETDDESVEAHVPVPILVKDGEADLWVTPDPGQPPRPASMLTRMCLSSQSHQVATVMGNPSSRTHPITEELGRPRNSSTGVGRFNAIGPTIVATGRAHRPNPALTFV